MTPPPWDPRAKYVQQSNARSSVEGEGLLQRDPQPGGVTLAGCAGGLTSGLPGHWGLVPLICSQLLTIGASCIQRGSGPKGSWRLPDVFIGYAEDTWPTDDNLNQQRAS